MREQLNEGMILPRPYSKTRGKVFFFWLPKVAKDILTIFHPFYSTPNDNLNGCISGEGEGPNRELVVAAGGQVRDANKDEADGMDETIIPLDYQSSGQITDDEILQRLVMPLPEGIPGSFIR